MVYLQCNWDYKLLRLDLSSTLMKVSMRANWAKSLILSNDFENVGSTFPSFPLLKINNAYNFLLLFGSLQQVK